MKDRINIVICNFMSLAADVMQALKILIVSDSHGNYTTLDEMIKKEFPFHVLIHCGDGVDDLFRVTVPPDVGIVRVSGNVDRGRGYRFERTVVEELHAKKIMVTHGDRHGVENDFDALRAEGKTADADIVFFGHTHKKYFNDGRPALFNPGPANSGLYGVVTIGASIEFVHKKIDHA